MDQRVANVEQKMVREENAPKASSARGKPEGVNDVTRYEQILRLFRTRKSYDTAIEQFRDFLRDYPKSSLAANAQYWIGEGYYAKGDYAHAISEFQVVADKYPEGEKVCDSLLKQGLAFLELKDTAKAKLFLTEVQRRCPKTVAATKASDRLAKLAAAKTKK